MRTEQVINLICLGLSIYFDAFYIWLGLLISYVVIRFLYDLYEMVV